MKIYEVKEIFYTLQGEGVWTGRPAVFCRFAGCNLWSGREAHRATAICRFCDTDFVGVDGSGGGQFATPEALADAVAACWPTPVPHARLYVVCTGGEPLLQLDQPLIAALHARGFAVAVETNGTLAAPFGLDWICVSPKAAAPLRLTWGDDATGAVCQSGIPAFLSATTGQPGAGSAYPGRLGLLSGSSPLATEPANAQIARYRLSRFRINDLRRWPIRAGVFDFGFAAAWDGVFRQGVASSCAWDRVASSA